MRLGLCVHVVCVMLTLTFILCSCTLRELFSELSVSSVVCF